MNAVEFEAVAKDGRIEIPPGYADSVTGPVRVILLYNAEPQTASSGYFDELMSNSIRVPGFVP